MRKTRYRAWDCREKTFIDIGFHVIGETTMFFCIEEYCYSNRDLDKNETTLERLGDIRLTESSGVYDKNEKELYDGDIIKSDDNKTYRIYNVAGGFAIKSDYWADNKSELQQGDELILQPLADAQTQSWIKSCCSVIGNIHENPDLLK